jgi:hypothetical protein
MGLVASGKIWVYDPKDPPKAGGGRGPSRAKRARSAAR